MSVFVYIIILLLPVATRALTPGVISSYISAPRKVLPGPIPPNSFKITRNVTQEQCAADCSLQYHLNQFHCYAFEYMASAKMCMLTNMTTLVLKGGYLGLIDNPNMNYFERSKGQYINLFQPYPNQVLEDQKTYFAVFHNMTLEKCALFCLIETRDTCMSFSYNPSKQVCGLSKVFYVENNGQKLVTSSSYNHYQYFSSWPCNATIPWNYSPRAIASPYFPYASVKDVNCHLVIEAPQGKQIDLVFSTFFSQSNLCENQRGGISVHDGSSESSSLLSQLCTSDHFVDRRFRSSKGYLYIEFATGSIPLAFKAVYDFIEVDPCSFSPCQNMGSCSSNAGQYMCRCVPGFTGRDCETNVNECANNPCLLGGTCVDLVNGFKCTCPNMLGGTRCDKYIGLCYLEPCQNGGECTPRGADRYLCQCPKGWGGTNCTEVVVDPCLSQPCFNGARCSASVDQRTYTCICAPGFSGGQCQTNINECENNPCFHNIPCTDLINDYRCECPSFMAGKNCERFVGRCSENPCVHGKCVPTGRDNYTCECEPSFTGSNCESLFINYCNPSPCKHGACRSFSNGPSCECDFGYDGFLCDQKKNYCEGVNCTQGECKNGDGDFRCECIVGFQGRYCNETINHCLEADCNGGYCINTVTSHFCVCSNGKTGLDCESHKPKCDATVCQNGTCVDKDGVSTCVCNQDFTGNECNKPIDYCINQPCKHGSCTSQPGGFQCSCDDNYTGATCSSEIDHCKINRCIYGFCQNLEDRFQCICAAGYHGDLCQYKPGETTTTTTTTTTTPSTTSSATTTKEATTTSTALSTQSSGCTQETCVHGICETDFMNLCICLPGFRGDKCDQFDGCSRHNPCRHGNCTDTLMGFTCSCEKGYSGLMCESRLLETDPCNQHPCSVGACVPSGNTFRCEMDVLTGASNFTSSNSQNLESTASPTVGPLHQRSDIECFSDSFAILLPYTLLPEVRNVTWREENCKVDHNGSHYLSTIMLTECGTTVRIENDTVTFSNDLIVHKTDANRNTVDDRSITFGEDYETVIPVKCIYPRYNNVSSSYIPVKQNVRFFEKRYGDLDVAMQQFESEQFDTAVDAGNYPRKIPLDDDVFIRVGLNFDPENLRVKTDQCIATSMPSPADKNWRPLIQKGCPEESVRLLSTVKSSDVKFAFKAFDFRHNSSGFVYIHCEVSVCDTNDESCTMGCESRAKRSASSRQKSHLVSTGPLFVEKKQKDSTGVVAVPTIVAAVCVLVAMAAIIVAVIGWKRTSEYTPAAI